MIAKLFQPYVSPLARRMVQNVLSGTWRGEGPLVKRFEDEFAKKFKSECPIMDEVEHEYFFVPNHYGVSEKIAHKISRIFMNSKLN